jgi:hypothetical protein
MVRVLNGVLWGEDGRIVRRKRIKGKEQLRMKDTDGCTISLYYKYMYNSRLFMVKINKGIKSGFAHCAHESRGAEFYVNVLA